MTNEEDINWIDLLIKDMKRNTLGAANFADPEYKDEVYEALDMTSQALKRSTALNDSEIRWVDKVSLDSDGNIRDFNGKKIGTGRIIPDGRGGWMYEGTVTEVQYTDGTSITHTCYTLSRNSDRCDVCGAPLPNNLGGSK